MGKIPIEYIIESNNDENLMNFLVAGSIHAEHNNVTSTKKNYFLQIKNDQYFAKTGKTIFQKFYAIHMNHDKLYRNTRDVPVAKKIDLCLFVMRLLLKEMSEIVDIQGETDIETVLLMTDEIYKHEILKLLIFYWKIDSKFYSYYKTKITELSTFYKLLIMLKENNHQTFTEIFSIYRDEVETSQNRWNVKVVQADCCLLLTLALKNGQKSVMKSIINCPILNISKITIDFDESSFTKENINYLMSKLLDNTNFGFELINTPIPFDYIDSQFLEDFLDSRVTEDNLQCLKINYTFLYDPKMDEKNAIDNGINTLNMILYSHKLRQLIIHPVLSTYIKIKSQKYRRWNEWNFFTFIILYMAPFFCLMTFYEDISRSTLSMLHIICTFSTFYLTVKEIIQFWMSIKATKRPTIHIQPSDSFAKQRQTWSMAIHNFYSTWMAHYFEKTTIRIEILIIVLSWIILTGLVAMKKEEFKMYFAFPSACVILLATVEVLSMLPYPSMSIYM